MTDPDPQFAFDGLEMEICRSYFRSPLKNLFDNRFRGRKFARPEKLTDLVLRKRAYVDLFERNAWKRWWTLLRIGWWSSR